jgi:hypothetical protein
MSALRVRCTIVQLMVAVAVSALLIWAEQMWERRAFLLERALVAEDRASDYIERRDCLDRHEGTDRPGMYRRLGDHWTAIARKYRHAAASPWLLVEPDSPQPEINSVIARYHID